MAIPHPETNDVADDHAQLPVEPAGGSADEEAGTRSTLALISDARHALAEARTLRDIRRVMEAASVAADAGRRAAKLVEAHGLAAEAVRDAEAAANDAAAVRIEAQAKAGDLLKEMKERGELAQRGQTKQERMSQRATSDLADHGVSRAESSRWQQVASVSPEVRTEYVEETKAAGGEVTTKGLLQHAEQAAVERWRAQTAPPETHRYRLALARTAEQASRIAQFDAEEAAQLVDENSAVVLESAASTWSSWVARFMRARGNLHVINGGQ